MKTQKIEGWRNVSMKFLLKGDELNPMHILVCPESRHKVCLKRRACQTQKPRCEWDKLDLVKKKMGEKLTKADTAEIKRILLASLKKCMRVTVTMSTEK